MTKRFAALLASTVLILVCLTPLFFLDQAQAQKNPETASGTTLTPSGTITFDYAQAAFILGGSGGDGTLIFKKKKYRLKLGGLGVGGFGAARFSAQGDVFNLRSLADFEGTFGQARMGYALGQGEGSLWLENTRGVALKLSAKTKGAMLSLGADGLVIKFAKQK